VEKVKAPNYSIEQLRKEYTDWLEKRVVILDKHNQGMPKSQAQEWLIDQEQYNTLEKREQVGRLEIMQQLEGILDLADFINLWYVFISQQVDASRFTIINQLERVRIIPNSWIDIHEDLRYYQQKWEEAGLTYQDAQEWLGIGLPSYQYELVAYAKTKGYSPFGISMKELRREYGQNWLDLNYPKEKRSEVTELRICNSSLEGYFDLSDFVNLKALYCNNNQLTSLDFLTGLNSEKLEILNISDNCFTDSDLTPLSKFVNLRWLNLGNQANAQSDNRNHFYGSLEPLRNLSKLEELFIDGTDIDSGLEYLPNSIKGFWCSAEREPKRKVILVEKELLRCGEPEHEYSSVGGPSLNFSNLLSIWKNHKAEEEQQKLQARIEIPPKN
jgi:hypothetical protein